MAERLARLYGPNYISNSISSPTTLFTVPTGKTYIVRSITAVTHQSSDSAGRANLLFGKGAVTPESLVGGINMTSLTTGPVVETIDDLAIPFYSGETMKSTYVTNRNFVSSSKYWSSGTSTWDGVKSTTDATSYTSANFTPAGGLGLSNFFFGVANTKATTPDVVSSITDSHTNPISNIGSIVTVATSTLRASLWGGYAKDDPSGASTFAVAFGGTQTACFADATSFNNAGSVNATPSTGSTILQTVSTTGTTQTTLTLPITPTSGIETGFLGVWVSDSADTDFAIGFSSTTVATGTLATPTTLAGYYWSRACPTNPAPVISPAGTSWAAVGLELVLGTVPSVTIDGIIIE